MGARGAGGKAGPRPGKHKPGKCCVYFESLADLREEVLAELVADYCRAAKERSGPLIRGRPEAVPGVRWRQLPRTAPGEPIAYCQRR